MKTVHKLSFAKHFFGFPKVVAGRLKWIWTSIWQHSSPGWFCGIPRVYWRSKRVRKGRGRAEKIPPSFVPVEALRGKTGLYIPWRPFLPLPNYFIVELEVWSVPYDLRKYFVIGLNNVSVTLNATLNPV